MPRGHPGQQKTQVRLILARRYPISPKTNYNWEGHFFIIIFVGSADVPINRCPLRNWTEFALTVEDKFCNKINLVKSL
jgi:hypothetical protein